MIETGTLPLLADALKILGSGFESLPEFETETDVESIRKVLMETAVRMQDNYPYPHPYYIGQMLKPPHPIARLAYMLSLWINPNNHALDGGRCSSAMEKEAVAELASMFGRQTHLGHLTSGGTMANLEALWISRRLAPGKKIVASQQAHYTHGRISGVLGMDFQEVPCDASARMDVSALEDILKAGDVGTVVVTMGTTATGSVDPLPEILELQKKYGFRIHADAAYGGYFTLADNLRDDTRKKFDNLDQVDSIVVDPHKHGLQPYGCGSVIFKDPAVGKFYKHESPYTYFTSTDLHLGEISLECSRAGASAVALWATHKLLPPVRGGKFARDLASCRAAALKLFDYLAGNNAFRVFFEPELDIVIWAMKRDKASGSSRAADAFFEEAAGRNLHAAKANLPMKLLQSYCPDVEWDQDFMTCLRSTVMKPEHLTWIDQIIEVLDSVENSLNKRERAV